MKSLVRLVTGGGGASSKKKQAMTEEQLYAQQQQWLMMQQQMQYAQMQNDPNLVPHYQVQGGMDHHGHMREHSEGSEEGSNRSEHEHNHDEEDDSGHFSQHGNSLPARQISPPPAQQRNLRQAPVRPPQNYEDEDEGSPRELNLQQPLRSTLVAIESTSRQRSATNPDPRFARSNMEEPTAKEENVLEKRNSVTSLPPELSQMSPQQLQQLVALHQLLQAQEGSGVSFKQLLQQQKEDGGQAAEVGRRENMVTMVGGRVNASDGSLASTNTQGSDSSRQQMRRTHMSAPALYESGEEGNMQAQLQSRWQQQQSELPLTNQNRALEPTVAGPLDDGRKNVMFVWKADPDTAVEVAGSWDGWRGRIPMQVDGWTHYVVLNLARGRYEYKYVVEGRWTFDVNKQKVEDGCGSFCNYFTI